MNSSDDPQRKLEALEAELNQASNQASNPSPPTPKSNPLQQLLKTFDRLPTPFKVGAIAVGIVLGLSILSKVLQLLISVVVVAIVAIVGYVLYKAFLEPDR